MLPNLQLSEIVPGNDSQDFFLVVVPSGAGGFAQTLHQFPALLCLSKIREYCAAV